MTIPLSTLANICVGLFSLFTACAILVYKKNFSLFWAIFILLFAEGISTILRPFMLSSFAFQSSYLFKLFFLSRAVLPIFLLLFSEYILKVRYHISFKLVCLAATIGIAFAALFQSSDVSESYAAVNYYFNGAMILLIMLHLLVRIVRESDLLMKRYLLIYFSSCAILLAGEWMKKYAPFPSTKMAGVIPCFVLAHGIIAIISSGGSLRLFQKIPKVLYIVAMSSLLPLTLLLLFPDISHSILFTLALLLSVSLSLFYMFREVSKNPRELRSAPMISRLVSMPKKNKEILYAQLRSWPEVEGIHPITSAEIEGNAQDLNLLFQKTGHVIHKFQMSGLEKVLAYNPAFISGTEIANYYFRKLDCQSLFQISDSGDFIGVRYSLGINPSLHTNELSIMSKIVFSIFNSETNS
jgi:hypothetical protein